MGNVGKKNNFETILLIGLGNIFFWNNTYVNAVAANIPKQIRPINDCGKKTLVATSPKPLVADEAAAELDPAFAIVVDATMTALFS